jgi:hypothetical protein
MGGRVFQSAVEQPTFAPLNTAKDPFKPPNKLLLSVLRPFRYQREKQILACKASSYTIFPQKNAPDCRFWPLRRQKNACFATRFFRNPRKPMMAWNLPPKKISLENLP